MYLYYIKEIEAFPLFTLQLMYKGKQETFKQHEIFHFVFLFLINTRIVMDTYNADDYFFRLLFWSSILFEEHIINIPRRLFASWVEEHVMIPLFI